MNRDISQTIAALVRREFEIWFIRTLVSSKKNMRAGKFSKDEIECVGSDWAVTKLASASKASHNAQ